MNIDTRDYMATQIYTTMLSRTQKNIVQSYSDEIKMMKEAYASANRMLIVKADMIASRIMDVHWVEAE